ncbi:hypothetical protein E2562_006810 [Oryza meyeriana var. granulata]|uniref:Uncharacterized protein n=1 Tax=Oryza meyeriana var. granulata TaxID=110450 RepID=A0A6G1C6C6_9ORYZ|nr:hypothetical protein E2562_006810 [Oryza meyeriana var. granulata]
MEDLEAGKEKSESALEEYKVKTRSHFDAFSEQVRHAESINKGILNIAKPLLEMLHPDGAGLSSSDSLQLLMQLQTAPAALKSFVKEKATLSLS